MLSFYNQELQTRAKEFIEKIKNDSKKLDKENQKFVQNIFTRGNTMYNYSYTGFLVESKIQELEGKKDVKFNIISLSSFVIFNLPFILIFF